MPTMSDKYHIAALSLLAAGALFIAIALLSNLGDMTTAAFVMAGMVFTLTGIFTWAFSGTAAVDPELVGILPAQGCINFCALTHDLGMGGHAFFLPPQYTGESRVMQFNPASTQEGLEMLTGKKGSPLRKTGHAGIVTQPSCDHLIRDLRTRNALVIPENREELSALLGEAVEDVFRFAQRISVTWEESRILVTFHQYPFMYGCKKIGDEYPACCVISPCPACSLCGALIAEGIGRIVTLDECTISSSGKDVCAVFSVVPLPDDTH